MATPMTAAQVTAQLKKWDLAYTEIPGWSTHNRNSKGAWGGVNGFIWHHTGATIAASSAKTYASGTLYQGRSDLPGPLCHFSIGADGKLFLVGWGRANHAGGGDPAVLQHVINEDYSGQLHPAKGNANGVDGNAHFYGVEIQYSGSQRMSAAQYKTALLLSAALIEHHGWSEKSVIGHGEWSNDKWDPGQASGRIMDMAAVRGDVKATLTAGPHAAAPASPSVSPSVSSKDTDMPQYENLGVAKPYTLAKGQDWDSIEFTTEWTDETGDHGTGGSVFVHGPARFTGSVSLTFEGLPVGDVVQVRQSEYEGDVFKADHAVHEVIGTEGGTFAVVPITNRLAKGRYMRIRMLNQSSKSITVKSAVLKALVWKEA